MIAISALRLELKLAVKIFPNKKGRETGTSQPNSITHPLSLSKKKHQPQFSIISVYSSQEMK